MRYFRLRFDRHDVEVPGELVVGRSEGCGLILDDAMVSRRHAVFRATESQLTVEDLGSRNGVTVNRVDIHGRVELTHGDVVVIGDQSFTVHVSNERAVATQRRVAVTLAGGDDDTRLGQRPTGQGSRAELIEDAFRTNNLAAVEFHLTNLLTTTLGEVQSGSGDPETLNTLTSFALRAAAASEKAGWIDWVFHLHRAAGRVLPGPAIDELFTLSRKIRYAYTPAMRAYLEALSGQVAKMTAPERFLLQRLEGLARMLRA